MNMFTYNYKYWLLKVVFVCLYISASAQNDTTLVSTDTTTAKARQPFIKRTRIDTSSSKMNMDAVYNRPFLNFGKVPIAIGGYAEANTQYSSADGVSDGFSFQFRRFTIFMSSTIMRRIKFLTEIEFEDGTKEINIEFAAMDIEFHPLVNLRGGIILNPIGSFNQNHDGPRWDFIDRPMSSTTIIPSTLSNAGVGLHGKYYVRSWSFGYEAYVTNGFNDRIIANADNRTSFAASKLDIERFERNVSGLPMFTGKIAVRNRNIGELGISALTGVYNQWRGDGLLLDRKRNATLLAVDFNTSLFKNRLSLNTEVVKALVEVPATYIQTYGSQQFGGYLDITGTVYQHKMLGWDNAKINIGIRLEYVDYNQERFRQTNGRIADDIWAIVPTVAFRPGNATVLRFNYRYQQQRDLFGNPPAKTGTIQFGFSTYF